MIFFSIILYAFIIGVALYLTGYTIPNGKYSGLTIAIIMIFSAIRYDVGWDFPYYVDIISDPYSLRFERFEWLQQQLGLLANYLNFYQLYFIVNTVITIGLFYKAICRYSTDINLSLLFFIAVPVFFLHSLSTVRYHTALAIIFYAFRFAKDRQYLKFAACVTIAFFTHKSSLCALLFIPLTLFPIGRVWNIIFFGGSAIISVFFISILEKITGGNPLVAAVTNYANMANSDTFNLLPIIFISFNVLNLLYYKRLSKQDVNGRLWVSMFNISCCLMLIFSIDATLSARFSRYFQCFGLYIIPLYLYPSVYRQIKKAAMLSIATFLWSYTLYTNHVSYKNGILEKDQYMPYKTFIFSDPSNF